jgi:hypothetical protein
LSIVAQCLAAELCRKTLLDENRVSMLECCMYSVVTGGITKQLVIYRCQCIICTVILKPYQVKECGGSTNPCAHTASSKSSSGQCCGTCCSRDPLLHTRARCPRLVDPLSERDCGLTNGAFAYRWWPCTMAFHILELYKPVRLLYVAQKGKHCT